MTACTSVVTVWCHQILYVKWPTGTEWPSSTEYITLNDLQAPDTFRSLNYKHWVHVHHVQAPGTFRLITCKHRVHHVKWPTSTGYISFKDPQAPDTQQNRIDQFRSMGNKSMIAKLIKMDPPSVAFILKILCLSFLWFWSIHKLAKSYILSKMKINNIALGLLVNPTNSFKGF